MQVHAGQDESTAEMKLYLMFYTGKNISTTLSAYVVVVPCRTNVDVRGATPGVRRCHAEYSDAVHNVTVMRPHVFLPFPSVVRRGHEQVLLALCKGNMTDVAAVEPSSCSTTVLEVAGQLRRWREQPDGVPSDA